jgi:hypothetical protein
MVTLLTYEEIKQLQNDITKAPELINGIPEMREDE